MMKISAQAAISFTLAANLSFVSAANPAIGVALSSGSIMINNAKAAGNATIFEGMTVETGLTGSRLQLKNGANIQLASESRGKIYENRLVLEKGNTQFQAAKPFEIQTSILRVSGAENASAQITMKGQTVQVASLMGTLKVANASGAFVTTIAPGTAFSFSSADADAPQDSSSSSKNKKAAGAAGASGTAAAASGGGAAVSTGMIVAGLVVVGTTVGVATYFGTQGSTAPQACTSPCNH
jgi:hypothetical protein